MFAALLVRGASCCKKPVLELLFGPVFTLTEEGWRKLTMRWALFFVAMAVVNELVWRNVSTDAWVSFKAFGFLPLTFLFAIAPDAADAAPRSGARRARERTPPRAERREPRP